MKCNLLRLLGLCFVLLLLLSACATPNIYRPEVDMFKRATSEIDSYVKAKRKSVKDFRADLRIEVLKSQTPLISLTKSCSKAIANLNESANKGAEPDLNVASECKLLAVDRKELSILYNTEEAFENSVAFVP